jgi:Pyruvate/2-oxoacid:ferredoxin oxidoreductase gamma subunit
MKGSILNIIVCGTGGRGVQHLSKLIRLLALRKGFGCEGASFKGGAQRMGTVYSELRIFDTDKFELISSHIPMGEVHVIIGLEPWEALRFSGRCSQDAKVIVNTDIESLFIQRFMDETLSNPVEMLASIFKNPILKNYNDIALDSTDSRRSVNVLILEDAISEGALPFTLEELKKVY